MHKAVGKIQFPLISSGKMSQKVQPEKHDTKFKTDLRKNLKVRKRRSPGVAENIHI